MQCETIILQVTSGQDLSFAVISKGIIENGLESASGRWSRADKPTTGPRRQHGTT